MNSNIEAFKDVVKFDEMFKDIEDKPDKDLKFSIDTTTEYEHILFNREDIKKMIGFISPIVNLKSQRVVPKSITFMYEDDEYKMMINNDVEYLTYKFKVLNKENRLKSTFCLSLDMIKLILKLSAEQILIYKKEDTLYVRLLVNGDVALPNITPEQDLIKKPYTEMRLIKVKEVGTEEENSYISSNMINNIVKSMLPIINDEPKIEKRRLVFDRDRVYFFSGKIYMQSLIDVPIFKLNNRVAEVIKRVTNQQEVGIIQFYTDPTRLSRFMFTCGDVFFTSTCGIVEENTQIRSYFDEMRKEKQIVVSCEDLRKVAYLSTSIPKNINQVELFYKDKELEVTIKTTQKSSVIKIPVRAELNDELNKLKEKVKVSAESFNKIVSSVGTHEEIIISITPTKIVFNAGNQTTILEV